MFEMGLGRVKTPTFNQRIEIPSRFRQFENQKCLRLLLGEDDRENNSAHFWRVHVFAQPGSFASSDGGQATSGIPRSTDIVRPARPVRFVPGANIRPGASLHSELMAT